MAILTKLSSSFHRRLLGGLVLRISTNATNPSPPKPNEFMVEEYLITSCGFSFDKATKVSKHLSHLKSSQKPDSVLGIIKTLVITSCGFSLDKATKVSKHLSHLKSSQKPDSVLGFIKSQGFDDTHIRDIVSSHPRLLLFDVDKNLAPKFRSLQDFGFSGSDLNHIILSNPGLLNFKLPTILTRIEFWSSLIGSTDHLIKIFKRGTWFLTSSIEKKAMPNLSLLRECGISDQRIALAVRQTPRFILMDPLQFKALVERVDALGVPRSSGNFLWALWALHHVSKARFNANLELMKSFGWSEAEFLAAFRKAPVFLNVSEKLLSEKMDFLVKEAGCEPSYIAHCPFLLMISLERRLIPRLQVVKILKSRGLVHREYKLSSIMIKSDKVFMEKYVIPHKEKVSELQEIYIAGFGRGGGH